MVDMIIKYKKIVKIIISFSLTKQAFIFGNSRIIDKILYSIFLYDTKEKDKNKNK